MEISRLFIGFVLGCALHFAQNLKSTPQRNSEGGDEKPLKLCYSRRAVSKIVRLQTTLLKGCPASCSIVFL